MPSSFSPARLVARRERQHLTLHELASLSGVNFRKINFFEHGLQPRPDELIRLAKALRCPVSELALAGVSNPFIGDGALVKEVVVAGVVLDEGEPSSTRGGLIVPVQLLNVEV